MYPARLAAVALLAICACKASPPSPPDAGAPDAAAPDNPPASITCVWPPQAAAGSDPLTIQVVGSSFLPGATLRWNGAPRPTVYLDAGVLQISLAADDLAVPQNVTLDVLNPAPGGQPANAATFSIQQLAARPPPTSRGLCTQFERRGYPNGYYPGDAIQSWTTFDSVVGSTVAQEVALQLDAQRALGINIVRYEIRSADPTYTGNFTPPDCNEPPVLGFQYPQPTATELTNFRAFLDLVASKGMRVWLDLNNTHMEEQPPTNNQTWLTAILQVAKGHPAVDLVLFDGTQYTIPSTPPRCGVPGEAPLWLGIGSVVATYEKWALGLAMSMGFSSRQLSAEAIVGAYNVEHAPAGSGLFPPIQTMKQIWDALGVPPDQRTYALSFYEANRCFTAGGLPCVDAPAPVAAEATIREVFDVIGRCSGARVVAGEMGLNVPTDGGYPTHLALEHLYALFQQYGVEGGAFWRWTSFQGSEDTDPTLATPVKWRGVAFQYSPVVNELLDQGGTHVGVVPNGSFERGDGGEVDLWTLRAADGGVAERHDLRTEPGQPELPTRGVYALHLSSGPDVSGAAGATSASIPVLPDAGYVLTGELRFAWTGDPDAGAPPDQRPQLRITLEYATADGGLSATRPGDAFRFFQEDATAGFATFPLQFTTPPDATSIRIDVAVEGRGVTNNVQADIDALR